jgi:hypothetical protein
MKRVLIMYGRKVLEEELEDYVRKNISLQANEQESQKYLHN